MAKIPLIFTVVFLTPLIANADFTIRMLSWTTSVHKQEIFLQNGEEFIELDLRSNRRSEPYPLGADRIAAFFIKDVNDAGEPVMVPIAKTEIKKELQEPLLIVFATGNKAPKPAYAAVAVEDSPEVFPFGSYRIFNFTPVRIVMEMEEEAYPMDPRTIQVLKPKKNERVNLPVQVHAMVEGEPQVIRQSYWRHQPTQRLMVFVMVGTKPGRQEMILKTISEREGAYHHLMPKDE